MTDWGGARRSAQIIIPAQRQGKSQMARLMAELGLIAESVIVDARSLQNRIVGTELRGIWIDHWDLYELDHGLAAEFKDDRFPELTVQVREEEVGKHDPRNRNPRAGRQKIWVIRGAGEPKTCHNLAQAKFLAQTRHKKAVDQALRQNNPADSLRASCDK